MDAPQSLPPMSSQVPADQALPTMELSSEVENMKIDGDYVDLEGNKFPETCFLRRLRSMVSKEFGEHAKNHKLMVIAVHAVFLESGFVQFDEFCFPDEWTTSVDFTMSFCYTLPEILSNKDYTSNLRESVVLKYQFVGHSVEVFGSLTSGGSAFYEVCLDENKFASALESLSGKGLGEFEREVYELWKIVKDGLAFPLLIDLCVKAGLPSPPCFMRLPSELQMTILDFLPGADIAKVGCVCKELQSLSNDDDLWKRKYAEEYGF